MIGKKVERVIIFFPLLKFENTYKLKYGEIGPVKKLLKNYPVLSNISFALEENKVDNESIEDPVVAISSSNYKKFKAEIECLGFLAASDFQNHAEDEILTNKVILTEYRNKEKTFIGIDRYGMFTPESFHSIKLINFPKEYFRWDKETILKYEDFLGNSLKYDLYNSLTECLSEVEDKETKKERSRIIISIILFNQSFIYLPIAQTFSKGQIVSIGAAFEALLNLPTEGISISFQNSIMTLTGMRTTLMKRWCSEFYDLRSRLVHGDSNWEDEEEKFSVSGNQKIEHSLIARRLFVYCLEIKLYLTGLLKEFNKQTVTYIFKK